MQLVTFLVNYNGYPVGASQYFDEELARRLIKNGLAKDAYAKTMTEKLEDVKDKILDNPPKDKMIRTPKKKK